MLFMLNFLKSCSTVSSKRAVHITASIPIGKRFFYFVLRRSRGFNFKTNRFHYPDQRSKSCGAFYSARFCCQSLFSINFFKNNYLQPEVNTPF
jgi:hypothetical protein